jgi:SARP family transcriptional regulator, regulator of embCAB operon
VVYPGIIDEETGKTRFERQRILSAVKQEFRYGILGPLCVSCDGADVTVSGVRRISLLVRLLISANQRVSVDRLIEDLWEGEAPGSARATLQSHISHLRGQLGTDQLTHTSAGYQLKVEHGALDADTFQVESRDGRERLAVSEFEAASDLLASSLNRWRGAALAEVNSAVWAIPEVSRLDNLRAATGGALLEALLAQGRNEETIEHAQLMLEQQPLRENIWSDLMLALYRSGRQAEALAAYQDIRRRLADELGLEPTRKLSELEESILLQKPELDWIGMESEEPVRRHSSSNRNVATTTAFLQQEGSEPSRLLLIHERTTLGRLPDNDISLPGDMRVSRHHTEIEEHLNGEWLVRDLRSRNGTYLNGERISESILRSGDRIKVGSHSFLFTAEQDPFATIEGTSTFGLG